MLFKSKVARGLQDVSIDEDLVEDVINIFKGTVVGSSKCQDGHLAQSSKPEKE